MVLGVTGSIAAYKAVEIASRLKKRGVGVYVIMTRSACEFVTPLTFETITAHPAACDMFHRETPWEVEHVSLAKRADVFLVAPASANFIGKYCHGIADDMLTTTAMAARAPMLIAPAMNTNMYLSAANQDNMRTLAERGVRFVEPDSGLLACGDIGPGRLAGVDAIVETTMGLLFPKRDYEGLRVMVTAGPTREAIDPVRYISNRSSGKMGYAVAAAAAGRGAKVTLISGPVHLAPPAGVEVVQVQSTQEMYEAALDCFERCDVAVKAAAPADFTPCERVDHKIKKGEGDLVLALRKTPDILSALGERKQKQFLCGFAAETNDVEAYAQGKLERKNLDMIAANDVTRPGAGFDVDTNAVTLFFREGGKLECEGTKRQVAETLLDEIRKRLVQE